MSPKGHKIPPFLSVSYSNQSTGSPIAIGHTAAGLVLVRGKEGDVDIGICFREHGKNWGRDI